MLCPTIPLFHKVLVSSLTHIYTEKKKRLLQVPKKKAFRVCCRKITLILFHPKDLLL